MKRILFYGALGIGSILLFGISGATWWAVMLGTLAVDILWTLWRQT